MMMTALTTLAPESSRQDHKVLFSLQRTDVEHKQNTHPTDVTVMGITTTATQHSTAQEPPATGFAPFTISKENRQPCSYVLSCNETQN